jgi:superfamily II RNA helicase
LLLLLLLLLLQVHGPCVTVKTRFRPVPLRWLYCYRDPGTAKPVLTSLLDSSGRKMNDRLRSDRWLQQEQR